MDPREVAKRDGPLPPLSDLLVLLFYNDVSESEDPSETDVLDAHQAVLDNLKKLGIPCQVISVADPRTFGRKLAEAPRGKAGTVVWNLYENTSGQWFSQTLIEVSLPVVGETFGYGVVGTDTLGAFLTTDKAKTRELLAENGIPVAAGVNFPFGITEEQFLKKIRPVFTEESNRDVLSCDIIVKPTSSDGSEGIEWKKSIFRKGGDLKKVWERVKELHATMNMGALAEQLVGDSELNISLLEDPKLRVGAVADIDFSRLPEGYPRIVDYASKWTPGDPMYLSCRRVPSDLDDESMELVKDIALRAFRATGMRDFCRVDFRCDVKDRHIDPDKIWVLEVNANPCISPGSGFHEGIKIMGTPFHEFVKSMVINAYKRSLDYCNWLQSQEKK